jgi:hypothetical protein
MKSHEITVFADLIPSNSPQKTSGAPAALVMTGQRSTGLTQWVRLLPLLSMNWVPSNRYYWLIQMD